MNTRPTESKPVITKKLQPAHIETTDSSAANTDPIGKRVPKYQPCRCTKGRENKKATNVFHG